MANTVNGNYRTTAALAMAAFDKLPPSARAALANAVENWVPQPILTRFNRGARGCENGPAIAKYVQKWDRDELVKREQQRAKATGPYKGNVPDKVIEYRAAVARKR